MTRRRRVRAENRGAPMWLVTYGDMFTLLLAFFVMLYALSVPDVEKFRALAEALSVRQISVENIDLDPEVEVEVIIQVTNVDGVLEFQQVEEVETGEILTDEEKAQLETQREASEELNRMASDFKTYFAVNNFQGSIDVYVSADYVKLIFGDGVLFDSGRADLKPEAVEIIDYVAQELTNYPDNEIRIEGHTDNVPIYVPPMFLNNMWLSAARAITVRDYFTDVKFLTAERISVEGKGEYSPVEPNDTPEGRAKNRRVEIKIMSKLYSAVLEPDKF